ncbi:hypothetical protein DSO57_1033019 [Entomophthora muscae]|uniref:Uncharacterized protein n=1 Tax=Entomophthora muscae TaxID=34485 RepID=A0ACC2T0C0_9FUNG|nr:hypothetical protein DSO57_1033019 [Entomophthora muscae]
MFKSLLASCVLAQPHLYIDSQPCFHAPASACYFAQAIHNQNRFWWDTIDITVTMNTTNIFSCWHILDGSCFMTSHPRARFSLSTRTLVITTDYFTITGLDMSPGWNLRKLGYGKKEYHAYSDGC